MIKCKDKGKWTCIARNGKPKKSFDTSDFAIQVSKIINTKNNSLNTKLVSYKCSHCFKYHLLTVNKKVK